MGNAPTGVSVNADALLLTADVTWEIGEIKSLLALLPQQGPLSQTVQGNLYLPEDPSSLFHENEEKVEKEEKTEKAVALESSVRQRLHTEMIDLVNESEKGTNQGNETSELNARLSLLENSFQAILRKNTAEQTALAEKKKVVKQGEEKFVSTRPEAEQGFQLAIQMGLLLFKSVMHTDPTLLGDSIGLAVSILSKVPPLSLAPGAEYPHEFDDALNPMVSFIKEYVIKNPKTSVAIKQKALAALFAVGLARGSFSQVFSALELISADTTTFSSLAPFLPRLFLLDPKPIEEARKVYAGTKWGWYQDRVNKSGYIELKHDGTIFYSPASSAGDWTINANGQCIAQFSGYIHNFSLSRSKKKIEICQNVRQLYRQRCI